MSYYRKICITFSPFMIQSNKRGDRMYNELFNNILKKLFLNGYQFNDIMEYFNLKKYELLAIYEEILLRYIPVEDDFYIRINREYLENSIFLNMYDEKTVIISDTHYGSKKDNLEYLYQLKDFIKKEKISIIFHGGDIGDGLITPSKRYNSYDKQIDRICKIHSQFSNIDQYILGGNHDMEYKKNKRDIIKILSNNDKNNIIPMGYYKAFFKVYNHIVALQHMKTKYAYKFIEPTFSIMGHSHRYRYKQNGNRIYIPPSCLENPGNYNPFIPGFLVMQALNKNLLQFQMYAYNPNGPIMMEQEKVYIK